MLSAGPAIAQQPAPPLPSKAPEERTVRDTEPKPDVWGVAEIEDANRICREALASTHAVVDDLPPIKKGNCGAPAPIRLISIGKSNPVSFKPAPTINCRMLVPLKHWIDKGLQPNASRYMDTRVKTVSIISSYSCRTRYGRPGARISEHAFANALDISGFRLADGRRVSVLKHWGPTRADTEKALAAARAAARAREAAAAANRAGQKAQPQGAPGQSELKVVRIAPRKTVPLPDQQPSTRRTKRKTEPDRQAPPSGRDVVRLPQQKKPESRDRSRVPDTRWSPPEAATGEALPPLPIRRPLRRAVRQKVSFGRNGVEAQPRPASTAPDKKDFKAPYRLGGPPSKEDAPKSRFLKSVHKTACNIFGTTLGPEANEAHRNHFHLDMFPRRRRGYCE
jgi:hypothetical protein